VELRRRVPSGICRRPCSPFAAALSPPDAAGPRRSGVAVCGRGDPRSGLLTRQTLASETRDPAPVAKRTLRCQTPEVRTEYGYSASPDLRGGPPERAVSTATAVPAVAGLDSVKNLRRRFRFSVGRPNSMTAHDSANRITQMECPIFAAHGRIRM